MQVHALIGLHLEQQHEQQGKLARGAADVAARIVEMEPGKPAPIDAKGKAKTAEQLLVLLLLLLELSPQGRLCNMVQVLSGIEQIEQ
ncbi:hypothetical protein D9M68_891120 [compost metagenome]